MTKAPAINATRSSAETLRVLLAAVAEIQRSDDPTSLERTMGTLVLQVSQLYGFAPYVKLALEISRVASCVLGATIYDGPINYRGLHLAHQVDMLKKARSTILQTTYELRGHLNMLGTTEVCLQEAKEHVNSLFKVLRDYDPWCGMATVNFEAHFNRITRLLLAPHGNDFDAIAEPMIETNGWPYAPEFSPLDGHLTNLGSHHYVEFAQSYSPL